MALKLNDRQNNENYKQHRLRVQNATSLVKSQAPKPKPSNEQMRNLTYLEMMKSLITTKNKSEAKIQNFKLILESKDNSKLQSKFVSKNLKFPIPFHVWQRYEHLPFMHNYQLMEKLLRPSIYFDLKINDQQSLGRIVIQLFTEACPEVVLQFVSTCLAKQHNHFHITRLLFPLWLEAVLRVNDNNALTFNTSNTIQHDVEAINHGSCSGILSFPSRYLRGSKYRFITFSLSFTAIDVLNGKRIAFGIMRCGQNVLERLQNIEVTRSGKPCQDVAVSACGVIY